MVGLKASTGENLVREREKNVILLEKQKIVTWATRVYDHKKHHAFSLPINVTNGGQRSQRQTATLWPWVSIRWGHLACEKKNLSDEIQCCHFPRFIPHESYIIDV
jgi:hypothetical protein